MIWMLIVGFAWALLAAPLTLLVGRSIRLADHMESTPHQRVPDFMPENWAASPGIVR
jgi:hypothetical protein